ncbi:PREDICTED: cubilin-like [Papilio xuthus]|uniref:Cubilin-like n=1 Tax=Papilio xuthus TaxID=66420 RepID=A0AAJ6ZLS3_PAPXU|nr:PREDICTED: cubilin-like [Papilio xuthus]
MLWIVIQFSFIITFCNVLIQCEVHQERPKIKTSNGDLILEPAYNKNIYLRRNGPKSSVYLGGLNVLNINTSSAPAQYQPASGSEFENDLQDINGISERLHRLENQNTPLPVDLLFNITLLSRKINRLNNRVSLLRTQMGRRVNNCESNPCRHGGTCLNLVTGYHCLCPSNWEGPKCEDDVNECRNFAGTDLGCQNGATCINRPGSYECFCRTGWFGLHCTRKAKDCSGGDFEMCGYGTCLTVTSGDGIKCICDQGWTTNGTGIACLTDVNECEQGVRCSVNPRVECINLPGSFRCGACPPGFEGNGYVCYDIDECLTLPNGGCSITPFVTCHNTIGSRICGPCPMGFQGDGVTCTWRGSCSINNGGCHPSARCVESRFSFTARMGQCVCPDGMYGDGIGVQGCYVPNSGNVTLQCEDNPCGEHGHCHSVRTGYTCICQKGFNGVHCENPANLCQSNPCQNGGSCRLDENSPGGFRCECTALYSGDLCQSHTTLCGGVLNHEEGSIIYPLSNATYSHNARCAWVIHTIPEKVINVTFSKFNLESSPDCLYDFLQIHDGRSSASQLIGRFCGSQFPKGGNIVSSHNNLYFWFRSDQSIAKDGFALHWTSTNPVCGGEIDASTHGHISSPGSPGRYPPNRDCYWRLTTAIGKRIQLHFFALDIESHVNCSFDYIAIYDGGHVKDPLIEKYCNSTQPAPLQSAGSELLIHFHSDAYNSGFGFQIAYAPVEGIPGCGGYFTGYRGEITSPNYNGKYISNLECEYKIKTSEDTKIRINFVSFALENSFRCKYDYVKIYDGPSSDSRFVGKFCGTSYPKSYTSTSNTLFIIFKSDHTMTSEGFRMTYESICHKQLYGDSGIIQSPGYPFSYPENKVCEYIINTSPGKSIQLTFQDFNIENNSYSDCIYDNVEIRDGPDINSTLLGRFCGSELLPPVQTSTFNIMYIRFRSDMSITGAGFYANYTTIDTECGGIHRDTTGVISHPSDSETSYKDNQSCTWMIIAPEGMHIKLTWDRFKLESQIRPSCTSDFVELYEIDDDNERSLLGRYCGFTIPPALISSTNRIMIKFESDNSIRETGFALSYSFVDERSHCGAFLVKSHGVIYSPGWPHVYEPNRDCIWTITVPIGQQIKLNISQFDLERPIRDKCDLGDYLEIRNGATEQTPLIGKYCGKFKSKRIISAANTLYLHFHSDFYLTGRGFKIEWDGTITGCGGTLTSANGSISSPNYPNNYNENAECFYRIVTSAGSRIRISFTDLDLEKTLHCMDDYVEIFDGRDTSALSLGKHCNMSQALRNIETSGNYAYIKFRSDFYISSKGFLLNYNTVCQRNLTGNYGVIESPGYPSNYPHYANCLWTITVPRGNKINVTFTHFDIFKSHRNFAWRRLETYVQVRPHVDTCDTDFVQISETDGTSVTEKLCGATLPKQINVQSNILNIKFKSGGYFSRSGFRLEWVKDGCGGHIQKIFGALSLDKRMNVAENEINCEWIIETPLGTSAKITFTELHMYDSKNCTEDAIEVYNGQSVDAPLITKICHRYSGMVQGSSNVLLVRFIKKSSLRNVFFNSYFDSFRSGCGGKITAPSGIIYSKNYPKNYDDNLDCIWSITVPKNHRIKLQMLEFDLYSEDNDDSSSCEDLVNIYETSNILDSNYTYHVCPKTNISEIVSKSNEMSLQFLTNGYGTAKGFKASFVMICGARITAARDGVINNKFLQESNETCTWTLLAPTPNLKIKLTITHLSIPKYTLDSTNTSRSCPASFLRLLDGDDEDSPLIDEYCGNKVPPMIVSHGSAMTIQLGTYVGKISGQFSAHYTTLTSACGGTLTSEEGTIASPNYPQSYPPESDCEWILSTSPGNKVYITFEELNIENSEGCNEDYLEVREDNGGGRLIGAFCGNVLPTNTTSASKLYIKFHSDSRDTGRGFLIHYGFLHGNDIIGLTRGEITSPLYPNTYEGRAEYTWRITIKNPSIIALSIDKLEIHNHGTTCQNYLAFYDGYNEEAPLLELMCGIITNQIKSLKTTSSVVYIKLHLEASNIGSLFHLHWEQADKDEGIEISDKANCGFNHTEIIAPGRSVSFTSPNYPLPYDNDLNCVWIFKSTVGRHLLLSFQDMFLEETQNCFADKVNIFSSNSLDQWTPLKENVCEYKAIKMSMNATTYLKVQFKTDNSVNQKGFSAKVSSMCGGELFNSGVIEPTWLDMQNIFSSMMRCEWKVKVRPGRNVKIVFENFNITSTDCSSYVIIHNGETRDSPLLGDGRYCGYTHEKLNDITSSSNAVFISSVMHVSRDSLGTFRNFKLRFEELNHVCGVTSSLDVDHPWEVISSPNYPYVPPPYTECVWVFIGPPGEILRIDFIERFDLEKSDSCISEYVEIREGSTINSPVKGRYCGDKPGTIKTSNNIMYIKYSTQLLEPRNGFKANISIDVCGGTIVATEGTLESPGYPQMPVLPYGTICKWNIIGPSVYSLKLQLKDLNLPDSVEPCATKLTISENSIPVNNTITILKEYCSDDIEEYSTPIDSFTNQVIVALSIGKPNDWDQITDNRGFKLTFSSWRPTCGGTVTTSEGYLTTPGYPRLTTLRFCQWKIKLPNSNRRVRLELLDFDIDNHRIGIYNDVQFQTLIEKIPGTNYSTTNKVFESSGSTLGIYVWLKPLGTKTHRFKAQFTSNDEAMCGGELSGITGELLDPDLQRSYLCSWHYSYDDVENNSNFQYNTMVIQANVNNPSIKKSCRFSEPRLTIKSIIMEDLAITRTICGGNKEETYRLPSNILDLTAVRNKDKNLSFHLKWKLQPCGGIVYVNEEMINVLNLTSNSNVSIDCAWVLVAPVNSKIEIKLEGEFQLECSNEFIQISRGTGMLTAIIGDYCKDRIPQNPLVTTYRYTFVEYHSNAKNNTKIKLIVKTATNQCGGILTKHERQFSSPNFPNNYIENQECIWEIKAEIGYRVSLQFVERFVIEDTPNCTKDALIIYDWKDDMYTEVAKLCGRRLPPAYNSTFNQMKVVFRTNSEINLDGFRAHWSSICGGIYKATEKEQILYSPGYNNGYLPSLKCEYQFIATDNRVELKFLTFDIEGTYPLCEYDNVTLSAHSQYDYFNEVYCGQEIPPPLKNVDEVQMVLSTDRYSSRKGFKLSYSIYNCGGNVSNNSHVIKFDKYERDLNCSWIIQAPVNKIVVLRFDYIDLESNPDCYNDYIAVYNGLSIDNNKRLALMCGNLNSSTIIRSSGNEVLLQFVTDSSVTYTGFKVEIIFSYSESTGCGGQIDLSPTSSHTLKSPLIGNSFVYENYLDCTWTIKAPHDYVVNVEFISFHVSSCYNVNQTAIGISTCNCDFVEFRDGINPNSLIIGTYCGHTLPPQIHSTYEYMSVRLATDGEIASSGFEAVLSAKESLCGQSVFTVTNNVQTLKSPRYDSGFVPRDLHCSYHLRADRYASIRISIKNLDLQSGSSDTNKCNNDYLLITSNAYPYNNISIGSNFILNPDVNSFFQISSFYEQTFPRTAVFCGVKKSVDLYVYGEISMYLKTTSESSRSYRGFDIEFVNSGFCGRNYTDTQGRIKSMYPLPDDSMDCYTLITAPEHHTVALYFIFISPDYDNDAVYLKIFDGANTTSPLLARFAKEGVAYVAVFSTGRSLLLHNHGENSRILSFDSTFVSTDKGRGCGGKLNNVVGRIMSPLYPEVYRQKSTCEWELETPHGTRLAVHFEVFDLGIVCDKNYVQLADRNGNTIYTYCSETPADYISSDNYVKIIFITDMNNGGTGWVADFAALAKS